MNKYSILLMILAAFAVSSCTKNGDFVRIDSINVLGDEFPQGQKIQMGISAEVSDPFAKYEWFCEAGTLLERQQGYVTMTWTAPQSSGEYVVGCTVTSGKATETRTVKIKISGLFFDRFTGATATGWSKTSNSLNLDLFDGMLTTAVTPTANAPGDSLGYTYRGLGVANFNPPVAVTAVTGVMGGVQNPNTPKYPVVAPRYAWMVENVDPTTNPPTISYRWTVGDEVPPMALTTRTPGWDNFMGYGLTGSDPGVALAPTHYISEVRLDWWPAETHMQSTLSYYSPTDDPEALLPPSVANAADFNARIAVRWTRRQDIGQGIQEYSGWMMIPFKHAAFNQAPDVGKIMGIQVTEDYTINVTVDREQVFTTDGLKTWRNTWQPGCPFVINEIKYLYPKSTRVFLDNVVATNNEFAY